MSRYSLVILSALSVVKAMPFHKNPMNVMMEHSNIGGYDQMALQQTPEYQIIIGKLHDVLNKPEIVKILKNKEFKKFIEPKNLMKHVKGDHFQMFMNPEALKAMEKSPIYTNIVSMPEMKQLIQKTGMGALAPKLPQIVPLLLEVFRERIKSKKPLPAPVEEFGQQLGLIPSAEALQQAQLDEAARGAEAVKAEAEARDYQLKSQQQNFDHMEERKYI